MASARPSYVEGQSGRVLSDVKEISVGAVLGSGGISLVLNVDVLYVVD